MKSMNPFLAFLFVVSAHYSVAQQKDLTFVFLHKKTDSEKLPEEETKKIMQGHMDNMGRLAKEGKLIAAGPFEGGGGIFIFSTASTDEAKTWLSTDPGVQAKRWDVEILPYKPRAGAPCKAPEPYQMVSYSFIRFNAVVTKHTAPTYPQIIGKHDDYLKQLGATGNVVAEGVFGDNEGGILIMKGEVQPDVFETDPGVQEGLLSLTVKKLWIAKGSFCEQ